MHHPWGRCAPGSWSRVRILSETISPDGDKIASATTRTTTLESVDAAGYTLRVETAVEIADNPVETAPQTLRLSFDDLPLSEAEHIHRAVLGPGSVEVEGTPVRVTIHQIEWTRPASKTVIKRFYSPEATPHVLKYESTTTDPKNDAALSQTVSQVIARDIPYPLGGEMHSVALVSETHKHGGGSIRRLSLHDPTVPGGLMGESTKEVDADGRLTRRSTLELVEFGAE